MYRDANLVLMLAIVIFLAAVISYLGIKTAEHLSLQGHAQEVGNRWGKVLVKATKNQKPDKGEIKDQLRLYISQSETALVTSGVYEVAIEYIDGNRVSLWQNSNLTSNPSVGDEIHSFWKHLSPFHNLSQQGALLNTNVLLSSPAAHIGKVSFIINVSNVAIHMGRIGNLAYASMLAVLVFVSLLGGVLVIRNSRSRYHYENELSIAKINAEEANRSKSAFIANVSHELRSPLNAIIGFSEIMVKEMLGPIRNRKYREYSQDIHNSGHLLLSLINDILDISKIEAGQMALLEGEIEISNVIVRLDKLVRELAIKADVQFTTHVPEKMPFLVADEQKTLQVLVNLCTNAIKFTQPGGEVKLDVVSDDEKGIIFSVADTGVGVASEDISKILKPFGQVLDPFIQQSEGTGLGLPIAKHIIEMHEGTFIFESEKNLGTTVTVTFPRKRVKQ